MAQHNFAEEINLADERLQINNVVIAPTDVMTGDFAPVREKVAALV